MTSPATNEAAAAGLEAKFDVVFDLLERTSTSSMDRAIQIVRSKADCVTVSFGSGNGQIRATSSTLREAFDQAACNLVDRAAAQRTTREAMLERQLAAQREIDADQRRLEDRARAVLAAAPEDGS